MAVQIEIAGKNPATGRDLLMCKGCEAILSFLSEDKVDLAGYQTVICPACGKINVVAYPRAAETPSQASVSASPAT